MKICELIILLCTIQRTLEDAPLHGGRALLSNEERNDHSSPYRGSKIAAHSAGTCIGYVQQADCGEYWTKKLQEKYKPLKIDSRQSSNEMNGNKKLEYCTRISSRLRPLDLRSSLEHLPLIVTLILGPSVAWAGSPRLIVVIDVSTQRFDAAKRRIT